MSRFVASSDARIAGSTALLLLLVYLLTMAGRLTSGDGETVYQTTKALVTRLQLSVPARPETALGRNGAHYGKYGLGQSLVQAPFYVAGHLAGRFFGAQDDRPARFAAGSVNAFVSAALAAAFWLVCRTLGVGPRSATAATLVLGLATPVWPYARSDFSEPLQTLCLMLAFLLTLWWGRTPTRALAAAIGCAAAAAFLTKAASSIVLVPLGALYLYYVWMHLRDRPLEALRMLAIPVAPLVAVALTQAALNQYRFGSVSEFGYGSEPAQGFTTPLATGVSYLLASSGKGLVWFAPPAVLGLALLPWHVRRLAAPMFVALGIFLVELVYFGRWWAWHGDWSWGPRYLYLTIPFLLIPLALLLHRAVVRGLALIAAAAGLVVALLGVLVDYGGYYSVVSSQIGRGVDVQDARLVPDFSPILGHAWLARASLHQAIATWRAPEHDARDNPEWGRHPWAERYPNLAPEAPERAVGFDLWFVALRGRTRFIEFWSWLAAGWLAACAVRVGVSLVRALRHAVSVQGATPAVLRRDIREPMELAWQRG